jgi:hypothetical protein
MWLIKAWMDPAKFNFEVQSVVAMRLLKIAAGGATGAAESTKNGSGEGGGLGGRPDRWIARPRKRRERKGGHESSDGTGQEKGQRKSEAVLRREVSATQKSTGSLCCLFVVRRTVTGGRS